MDDLHSRLMRSHKACAKVVCAPFDWFRGYKQKDNLVALIITPYLKVVDVDIETPS